MKEKTISPHKLGFCNYCFPNDSLYYGKLTYTIFQGRGEL